MLSVSQRRQLDEEGWLALPGLMSRELLDALRSRVEELFAEEGASAGAEFKMEPGARRLANLVNKGANLRRSIVTPVLLECMAQVLGPRFKLSSLNVRSTNPTPMTGQPLHADSGAIADEVGPLGVQFGLDAGRFHAPKMELHAIRAGVASLGPHSTARFLRVRTPRSG